MKPCYHIPCPMCGRRCGGHRLRRRRNPQKPEPEPEPKNSNTDIICFRCAVALAMHGKYEDNEVVLMCKHEDPPWIFVATMGQLGYNTEIDVVLRCMNKLHEDVCARSRFYITREKYGTEFKQWYAKNCNNGQMTKLDFDQLKRYDVEALRKHSKKRSPGRVTRIG